MDDAVIQRVFDLAPPPEGAVRVIVVQSDAMSCASWEDFSRHFLEALRSHGIEAMVLLARSDEDISVRLVDAVTGRETFDLPMTADSNRSAWSEFKAALEKLDPPIERSDAWPYPKIKAHLDASGHKPSPIELPEPAGFKIEPRGER